MRACEAGPSDRGWQEPEADLPKAPLGGLGGLPPILIKTCLEGPSLLGPGAQAPGPDGAYAPPLVALGGLPQAIRPPKASNHEKIRGENKSWAAL